MPIFRRKKQPEFHAVTIADADVVLHVKPGTTLLQAALDADIAFPNLCRVGSCGRCKCRLVSGKSKSLVDLSYVLPADEIRDGAILACQALLSSDATVALPQGEWVDGRLYTFDD